MGPFENLQLQIVQGLIFGRVVDLNQPLILMRSLAF